MFAPPAHPRRMLTMATALCASPVVAIFLSANLANLGNLAFNVLFSRWMGPILFGQLATLLTLFLGVMAVLGALQLAVSQRIAANRDETLLPALARLSKRGLILAVAALPVLIALTLVTNIGPALGLDAVGMLPILLLCLPFALPLALARGVATGKLDARAGDPVGTGRDVGSPDRGRARLACGPWAARGDRRHRAVGAGGLASAAPRTWRTQRRCT